MWATDELYYTLEPASTGSNSSPHNDYTAAATKTIDEIEWSVTGNSNMVPWRIGGKNISSVDRTVFSNTAMGAAITEVKLEVGTASSITVNSLKLIVSTAADGGGTKIDEVSATFAASSTISFKPTSPATQWAKDAYYKFVFNVSVSVNSNKYVEFKNAKFYTPSVEKTDPTITFNDGSVRIGKTLDLSTLFTSNSSGAVTYSITSGDSYASIDGSTLTAGATTGSVTVQASQATTLTYNAKTATATITVVDPALSSIAITTEPTKTTYDEGDLFDATGMVVTATFADASTEDVTASCTWAPSGALSTSDTEITVSYTYNAVTKTDTQDITVNAYVQPTEFDIALNNTLFGTSYTGSVSGITDETPVSGKYNRVNVAYAGSGNHYINDSQIRFYPNNKLTFVAPTGFVITKIVFTSAGTWAATISSDKGTYTSDSKTWAGEASTVLFTGSGSSRCDISKVAVTLSSTATITIASSGYSTIARDFGLDFASATPAGLEAYVVPSITKDAVSLSAVDEAPASTGVILKGTADTKYTIPVKVSAAAVITNKLNAAVTATTLADGSFYIMKGGKFCLVTGAADAAARTVPAGKAYLLAEDVPASAPEFLDFIFGDMQTTGVNDVRSKTADEFATPHSALQRRGDFFDLQGRKVANPKKGLYIVNGKKVAIK